MSATPLPTDELPGSARTTLHANASGLRAVAVTAMALVLATFALLWPTTASLLERWQDAVARTYTHGLVVVALSLWLLWRNRAQYTAAAQPSAVGFAVLAMGGVLWLIALGSGLQILHQALLPLLVAACLLTCFGPKLTRRMAPAVAYLYFAIPIWDAINGVLQWVSVFAVRVLLRLAGIPAYFQGNTFQVPAGVFEIAGGCSGLHFFVVALAIAVLYGEIERERLLTRARLVLLAVVLALATNWIRVFIIVVAGHVTDMQHYLVREEHYSFGWVLFAVSMMVFFLIVRRWPIDESDSAQPELNSAPSGGRIVVAGLGMAAAGLLLPALWHLAVVLRADTAEQVQMLPAQVPQWRHEAAIQGDWQPVFVGAESQERTLYVSDGAEVDAYAAVYKRQRQGRELIGFGNSVVGASLRRASRPGPAVVAPWIEQRVSDSGGNVWMIWYAYRVADGWYARELQTQVAVGLRSLWSVPPASVIALRSRCSADCEDARVALSRFAATAWQVE